MSITLSGFCAAVRKALAVSLHVEREERARLEEFARRKQALEAERQAEWARRHSEEAIAAAAEAKRQRDAANYAVWQAAKDKRRKRR